MAFAQQNTYTENDYYNLPENVRAELIHGQIYYMAALSRIHQKILSELHLAIGQYIREKGGPCEIYPAPFAVRLFQDDDKTIVEPDLSIICNPDKLTARGCTGAPDWIIEIVSPTTSSHDYIRKLNLYANTAVREYWIVNPMEQTIYVYFLEKDKFAAKSFTFQDNIKVSIYDDLWVDFRELNFHL